MDDPADIAKRVVRDRQSAERQVMEARAQALYDASNTSSTPWARRGRAVRDAWLQVAINEAKPPV